MSRLSERKQLQNKFWNEIHSRLQSVGIVPRDKERTPSQIVKSPHVYEVRLGSQHGFLSCIIDTQDHLLKSRLFLTNRKSLDSENTAKIVYKKLCRQKRKIEDEMEGEGLLWNPPPKGRNDWDTRTIESNRFFNIDNDDEWENALDWMASTIVRQCCVFKHRLRNIIN